MDNWIGWLPPDVVIEAGAALTLNALVNAVMFSAVLWLGIVYVAFLI